MKIDLLQAKNWKDSFLHGGKWSVAQQCKIHFQY